jgi:hypothetical protein
MLTTFKGLLTISLLLALASLSIPFVNLALANLLSLNQPIVIPTEIVYPITLLWLMTLISALTRYGKRGLWLLVGFPVAFFWPIGFIVFSLYTNFL